MAASIVNIIAVKTDNILASTTEIDEAILVAEKSNNSNK